MKNWYGLRRPFSTNSILPTVSKYKLLWIKNPTGFLRLICSILKRPRVRYLWSASPRVTISHFFHDLFVEVDWCFKPLVSKEHVAKMLHYFPVHSLDYFLWIYLRLVSMWANTVIKKKYICVQFSSNKNYYSKHQSVK